MHRFMLFSTLPADRHEQALGILAGVCAAQPTPFVEKQIILAPRRTPTSNGDTIVQKKRSTQQTVDLQRYYHHFTRGMDASTFAPISDWSLSVKQEPEAGSPHLISQPYFTPEGDVKKYEDKTSFTYAGTQFSIGDYFVQNNVVIKVFRIMVPQTQSSEPPFTTTIAEADLNPIDGSGSYIVEASVRLEDRSNSKLSDLATRELLELKRTLQGAIQLYAPDRLALDTRIREG